MNKKEDGFVSKVLTEMDPIGIDVQEKMNTKGKETCDKGIVDDKKDNNKVEANDVLKDDESIFGANSNEK